MKKSTKTFLKISGAGVVLATFASIVAYKTTKSLVAAAIDRNEPKLIQKAEKKFTGSRVGEKFFDEINDAAERLSKKETETVEITSSDGVTLVGHWYPCENAKRVVLAMHGWRSSWTRDFGLSADFWHENGCSVLFAEQRGQNNSGGEYIGFGLYERYDCIDWLNYLRENKNTDLPVYLVGISMGATTVLMAAGLDLPDEVHGIIADCGFTSPHDIWKHTAEKSFKIPYNLHGILAGEMFRKKTNMRPSDYSTIEAVSVCAAPILFIHGSEDKVVPVEMTYKNYVACTAKKRLLIVPGADHGMSYYCEKERYEQEVSAFFKEYD